MDALWNLVALGGKGEGGREEGRKGGREVLYLGYEKYGVWETPGDVRVIMVIFFNPKTKNHTLITLLFIRSEQASKSFILHSTIFHPSIHPSMIPYHPIRFTYPTTYQSLSLSLSLSHFLSILSQKTLKITNNIHLSPPL